MSRPGPHESIKHKNVTPFQPLRGKKLKERVKTAQEIAVAASVAGCCERCAGQVKWKERYGKFKLLAQPRKCNGCHNHAVRASYHNMCRDCARARNVCPKCQTSAATPIVPSAVAQHQSAADALASQLAAMSERQRRTAKRALDAGRLLPKALTRPSGAGDDDEEEEEEGSEGDSGEEAEEPTAAKKGAAPCSAAAPDDSDGGGGGSDNDDDDA